MASTNKVFVSPGVYTSERDLTFVAQSVGVTTLGIVGETLQGPAFEPIFITNFDEYQVYFGGTSPEKFTNTQIPKYETSYIAKAYLQQSNQLFVTRVLGLSGYDAGPSWSISTIGNVDPNTIGFSSNTTPAQILNFTGTTGGSSNVVFTGTLPALISNDFYIPYTTFNGGTSTLAANFQSFIANEITYRSTPSLNVQSGTTALFWGTVSDATFAAVTGSTIGAGLSAYSETFGVDNVLLSQTDFTATSNDPWYYALFDYSQVGGVGSYGGYGFGTVLGAITTIGTGAYSGYCIVSGTTYSGTPYSDWDNLVIATLRSRGITNYSSTQHGPLYQVTGITDVNMVCTGSYSAVTKVPYATFVISGITPVLAGRGEAGVRSKSHAESLSRLGSSRAKKRALIIEDALEKVATLYLKCIQKYQPIMLKDDDGNDFIPEQFTDDFIVKVDAHSNSPIFTEDLRNLAFSLHQAGAIDQEGLLDLLEPPMKQLLKEKLATNKAKQEEMAMLQQQQQQQQPKPSSPPNLQEVA